MLIKISEAVWIFLPLRMVKVIQFVSHRVQSSFRWGRGELRRKGEKLHLREETRNKDLLRFQLDERRRKQEEGRKKKQRNKVESHIEISED